jgi:1-acyl-sn-glycerol-3-phosphate acyltransferase
LQAGSGSGARGRYARRRRLLYRLVTRLLAPVAWWGRLRVEGEGTVPEAGSLLLVPNHDSQWDPVIVGLALRRRRQLRFLARANLWKIPGLGPLLHRLGQIPIERGAADALALEAATEALGAGEAICVFPEGRLSRGERLRARSGVGRLASRCPGVTVVLCAVTGTTDFARFPRRPRVSVSFFHPGGGQPRPDEGAAELATRLLDEIREGVPPVPAGRRHREAAASVG